MKIQEFIIFSLLLTLTFECNACVPSKLKINTVNTSLINEELLTNGDLIENRVRTLSLETSKILNQENLPRIPFAANRIFNGTFYRINGNLQGGSVISFDKSFGWMSKFVGMPTFLYDENRFKMWFVGDDGSYPGNSSIGYAESIDGINWSIKNNGLPVFMPSDNLTSFDSKFVSHPSVIKKSNQYWMWYSGGDGTIPKNASSRIERIGVAVSNDGMYWDRVNWGAPVLDIGSKGSVDDIQVSNPSVIVDFDGIYRMYYSAYHHNLHSIRLAYSFDGLNFFKESDGDELHGLDPEEFGALGPAVYFDGTSYLMYYSRVINNEWKMESAISDDGINWRRNTNHSDQGVIGRAIKGRFDEGGPGKNHSVHPSLPIIYGDNIFIFYTGESNYYQSIGVAIQEIKSSKPK